MSERDIARSANNTRPAKLPAMNVPRELENQLRTLLEAMKERLEVREGARGNPFERALTVRDLEQFKTQDAPAAEAAQQTTASGITESRVKQLVGDALSVEINTLRAAIATIERTLPTLSSATKAGDGVSNAESMAHGTASRFTKAQLSADLASGGAKILSGALAGTTVMELDPLGNYVLFKHRNANLAGVAGPYPYQGAVRTAVGITADGFLAGFNRKSDGAWQNSIVIESGTGNVTILGTLKASSVLEAGVTVGAGGTTIGTIQSLAATALQAADITGKLNIAGAAILTGPVTLQTTSALTVGTPALNNEAGRNGFYIGSTGIVGTKNGLATFTLDNSGNAIFKGDITGATGSFSGSISTSGAAYFNGKTPGVGANISIGGTPYALEYSSLSNGNSDAATGSVRVGVFGYADAAVSFKNVGVFGKGSGTAGKGFGVVGDGTDTGGYFSTSNGYAGLVGYHGNGGVAIECNGSFKFGSHIYAQPTAASPASQFMCRNGTWATPPAGTTITYGGGTTTYLRNDGAWATPPAGTTLTFSGSTTAFLRNDGQWVAPSKDGGNAASLGGFVDTSYARIFTTNDTTLISSAYTANASGAGIELLGGTGTDITGAYVRTSGSGNIVTFTVRNTQPSDIRLKENVEDVTLGLDFINQLRPVSYNLIDDKSKRTGFGFIAQEVEKLGVMGTTLVFNDPEAVTGDVKGHMVVHYPSYVAVLTKALQELDDKFSTLQARFLLLEAKLQVGNP